jgi:post-segregation antitoxin (ccd killing protein)
MASINIYLPDELKDRMAGVDANWSEICQQAIEAELLRLQSQTPEASDVYQSSQGNSDKKVVAVSISQHLVDQGTVIKLPAHGNGRSKAEVLDISDWIERISTNISSVNAINGRVSRLFDNQYKSEILIPGQPWRSGSMKMDLQFMFTYSPEESEFVSVQDA